MKVAIMQPYLFPYIGYFQLIKAVDKFIIYDDVQFIKNGWINRNNILINNQKHLITLGIKKDSLKKNINQRSFSDDFISNKTKILKTIDFAYNKAPYYGQGRNLVEKCFQNNNKNISTFITNSLNMICSYLKIETDLILSSTINDEKKLKKQERVINLVKTSNGDHYINSIGGRELYSKEIFKKNNIKLNFIQTKEIFYKQFKNEFIPNLSIIDILMFNSKSKIIEMLNQYDLL